MICKYIFIQSNNFVSNKIYFHHITFFYDFKVYFHSIKTSLYSIKYILIVSPFFMYQNTFSFSQSKFVFNKKHFYYIYIYFFHLSRKYFCYINFSLNIFLVNIFGLPFVFKKVRILLSVCKLNNSTNMCKRC